jgi:hypothetical protein
MRAFGKIVIAVAAVAATACGTATTATGASKSGSASEHTQTTQATRPVGTVASACAGVRSCRVVARVDVDGDGHADQVAWHQLSKSLVQVRVRTAAGQLLVHRVDVKFWWGGGAWGGAAYVDGRAGRELLVGSMQGAHTPMYTMLTYRSGRLVKEVSPSSLSPLWQIDAAYGDDIGWWRHVTPGHQIRLTQRIAVRDLGRQTFGGHDTSWAWTKHGWDQLSRKPTTYGSPRAASAIGGFHVAGLAAFPGLR